MLNKKELAALHAGKHGLSKKDAEALFEQVIETLADAVENHGGFKLNPLFTAEVVPTAERQGRNPASGETIVIPASQKLKIKQLKGVKQLIK